MVDEVREPSLTAVRETTFTKERGHLGCRRIESLILGADAAKTEKLKGRYDERTWLDQKGRDGGGFYLKWEN